MCWLHLCSLTAKSIHHLLPVSERIWKPVGTLTIRFPLKGLPYPAPPCLVPPEVKHCRKTRSISCCLCMHLSLSNIHPYCQLPKLPSWQFHLIVGLWTLHLPLIQMLFRTYLMFWEYSSWTWEILRTSREIICMTMSK